MARRQGASALGLNDLDVTVATSFGATRGEPGHHPKREVSFFAADSREIRARLRPIFDAGFSIEGVTTPCGALWSQARLRRASLPGEVHAHVALGVSQSALGIFGDGGLLYARDLDWGYATHSVGAPIALDREILADRLATELRRSSLYLKQYWDQDVSQLLLCGDMPEIRSLTAPLIELLNIEAEMLDTLEGIDARTLPDGFANRAAIFRLASSIAVEPPPVNLLPVEVTAIRTTTLARRIVAGGTAAAIAYAAFLYGRASAERIDAERRLAVVQRQVTPSEQSGKVRRAALTALDEQGPTMARVLEAIANAAPKGVTLKSLRALPDGNYWNVTVEAFAPSRDVGEARVTAEDFLRALAASPLFAQPLRSATRRDVPGSGVEIAAAYRVRK
jgi:Tfp pilus assembly protein PilN